MASPSTTPSAPIAAEAVPVAEGTPATVLPPLGSMASLYVGDLAETVDEPQLHALFSQVAPVATVRVCRDILSGVSLGYGYVNFYSRQEATRALEALNLTPLSGKYIRVMFSNRDPSLRKSGRANLFVKNLEPNIDSKTLYETFSSFGTILSCKVATDSAGQSKGYGFVQYETEESAEAAINRLNGMLANGRKMFVGLHMRRRDREVKFTNVYIKNLPTEFSDDDLRQEFAPFGEITSAVVMRDDNGVSKCFGFVNFKKPEFAIEAVKKADGKAIGDKTLYVGRAQKKEERKAELKTRFGRGRDNKVDKPNGINLYLKNIDDDINDEGLKKLFEEFGQVASSKVMVDARGRSKGSGFVSFATAEAGQRAINRMNGRIVGKKPLYVGLAQPKEERRAMLMAHFAQRDLAMAASQYAGPQQVYFGHPAPGQLPPPQGAVFGFPPHFVPGMGPISPVMMPPHNMQRPRYPGPGGQSAGGPAPYRQQQAMIHANANHMPNARPGPYPAMLPQAFPSAMASQQHAGSRITTAVAPAGPADQHQILGNKLYPLVEQLERDHAGKVTGMLLEMDKAEILQLLRSPEALRAKVREAMAVLQRTKAGGSVDPAAAAVAKTGDSAGANPAAAAVVKAGSSADPAAAIAAPTVNA